jgi:hypothetical protein
MIYFIIYILSVIITICLNPRFKDNFIPPEGYEQIMDDLERKKKRDIILAFLPVINTLTLIIAFFRGIKIGIDLYKRMEQP